MMLARFFRPKWQHPNPQIRRQALLRLPLQDAQAQEILRRLAVDDAEAEVRKTAVKRIGELAFLRLRAEQDDNAGVREVAAARYRQLLAGGAEAADLATRLAELQTCAADEALLGYVARRAREPELRLAAVERLEAAAVLEEIAVHDRVPKVRQAAVLRLTEAASLERVMQQSRAQDRRVARIAREALERLRQEQAAAEEARRERLQICLALEALAAADQVDDPERQRLHNRWDAIAVSAEPDLQQRFAAAMAQCLTRAAQPAPAAPPQPEPAAAPGGDRQGLHALLQELGQQAQPTPESLERIRAALADEAGAEAELEPQLALLREYLRAGERYLAQEDQLKALLAAVSGSAEHPMPELQRGVKRLLELLGALRWPPEFSAPRLLQEAQMALSTASERLEQAGMQQQRLQNELEQALAALKSSLDAGHLRESQRLLAQAQRLTEQVLPAERRRFDRRLKQGAARVRELQDWRRFATLPKQEQLCEQMEALVDADLPPPELAERIRRLQEEWKATGGSGSPEGQQLWERFRTAGDQAFARCREYFDQQAQRREENLRQRQQIAQQLEQFIASAKWPQLELTGLEAIRSQARAEWLAAAPVDRRAGRTVEERFEALMAALTEQIRAKQQSNRQRKEAIIEQAKHLFASEDAWEAAEQAKALQNEWQAVGRAQPNVDRRLWREFRAACDEIFARRDAARGQAEQERAGHLLAAQALCEQAEALLAEPELVATELEGRVNALRQEFEALQPLPRAQFGALTQRLRTVERQVSERLRHKQHIKEQQALGAARDRAALCAELEQAGLAATEGSVDQWQQRWQALAEAPADVQPKLEQRWRRALAAAEGAQAFSDAELQANLDERWDLCLWMEILAGLESPPEEQNRRMNVQVRRLADGLATGGARSQAEQVRAVEAEWWAVGPTPATAQAQQFLSRFEAARAAIGGRSQ